MAPRSRPLREPPIMFAHRGAKAHARENTLEAFELACRLGATGLESDVWLTADGQVVLDHDGVVGRWPSKQAMAGVPRSALPAHVPTLDELYATCGTDVELSLDVKDPAAFPVVADIARAAGSGAPGRLWLCHPDLDLVSSWRRLAVDVRLVDSTRVSRLREGVRHRAVILADRGIDAVNMHWLDWSEHLVGLFHQVGVHAFGWDVQSKGALDRALEAGVDAIYSDHVERMVDAVAAAYP